MTKKTAAKDRDFNLRGAFGQLGNRMLADLGLSDYIDHSGPKGRNAELNWRRMLRNFLPERYQVDEAFVVDVHGVVSEQQDIVIYDRQYSPLLFKHRGALYVPAESVYGVFEVKPHLDRAYMTYAGAKVASVRRLQRTSSGIVHAGGTYAPVTPKRIIGGVLARRIDWAVPFEAKLEDSLDSLENLNQIDLGIGLAHGAFDYRPGTAQDRDGGGLIVQSGSDALLFFALRLFRRLQRLGTVPAIDIDLWGAATGLASVRAIVQPSTNSGVSLNLKARD